MPGEQAEEERRQPQRVAVGADVVEAREEHRAERSRRRSPPRAGSSRRPASRAARARPPGSPGRAALRRSRRPATPSAASACRDPRDWPARNSAATPPWRTEAPRPRPAASAIASTSISAKTRSLQRPRMSPPVPRNQPRAHEQEQHFESDHAAVAGQLDEWRLQQHVGAVPHAAVPGLLSSHARVS